MAKDKQIPAYEVREGAVLKFGNAFFYVFDTATLSDDRIALHGCHTDLGYWECVNGHADPGATSILDDESLVTLTGYMPGSTEG